MIASLSYPQSEKKNQNHQDNDDDAMSCDTKIQTTTLSPHPSNRSVKEFSIKFFLLSILSTKLEDQELSKEQQVIIQMKFIPLLQLLLLISLKSIKSIMNINRIKLNSFLLAQLLFVGPPLFWSGSVQSSAPDRESPTPLWLHGKSDQLSAPSSSSSSSSSTGNDRLSKILNRVGPNMRASSDFHDFNDITVEDSLNFWQALESRTRDYAQGQVDYYQPKISSFLSSANVSLACRQSADLTLNAIKQLDSWAIQLWNSIGQFPPTGLLDGELTDLGSYHNCVDLVVPDTRINHTSYCMFAFRPIVPSRKAFHMVFQKENQLLVKQFNRSNIFSSLANRAQYFHYLYVKTAICVPSQCTPEDMQQVASLIARRWFLNTGPVKCFTRAPLTQVTRKPSKLDRLIFDEIENEPVWIGIGTRNMNTFQIISLIIIVIFYSLIALASLWHLIDMYILKGRCCSDRSSSYVIVKQPQQMKPNHPTETVDQHQQQQQQQQQQQLTSDNSNPLQVTKLLEPTTADDGSGLIKRIAFDYLSVITNGKEFFDTRWKSNEITCLHGLRVITMIWIIIVHCLQYNEWSGFTRVFENEATLQNPILHPIYNANYVVDNFFFMSGLLASFSSWSLIGKSSKDLGPHSVRIISNIINRYLRLTPQVLLVSMLYILLPLLKHGPFWYDMTEHAGKYCEKNWWVNLLHMQAFYNEDEICNLVGWWISVDMFFYLTALVITYLVLTNRIKLALQSTVAWISCCMVIAAGKHYNSGYPPNNLGTIPQVSEVWTRYVVNYFWSPFTHAYPFYLGLWVGYILAKDKWRQWTKSWSNFGTITSTLLLITINMSSHMWMSGMVDIGSQWTSTLYNLVCPIIWINGLAWFVIACHYGCMPMVNKILSVKLFVLLSKASFIIYLSHMLELRLYFGSQVTLLEVAPLTLLFIVTGNAFASIMFGVFLCITFEGPTMKFQKFVATKIRAISRGSVKTQTIDLPENRRLKEVINC